MQYDIDWVLGLRESDLILCNLLSFMRLYHYNMRFADISKCIDLEPAEAYGITRISVKLRTQDDKKFMPPPYFIHDNEAERFKEKLIEYYEARSG